MSRQLNNLDYLSKEQSLFVTTTLRQQLMLDPKMEERVIEDIVRIIRSLKPFTGIERAKKAHAMYEDMFPPYLESIKPHIPRAPICSKSCNACCYQYLAVCKEEAELVYDMASKAGILPSIKTIRYQARFTHPDHYWSRFGKRTKCGFLHLEKGCLIYANRPLSCRSLLSVEESSDMCIPNEDGSPKKVKYIFNYPSELLITVLLNLSLQEESAIDRNTHTPNRESPIASLPRRLLKLMEKR